MSAAPEATGREVRITTRMVRQARAARLRSAAAEERGGYVNPIDHDRAALAAVLPDYTAEVEARVRRECAAEMRAELDRISEKSRPGNPRMRDLEHASHTARLVAAGQLRALADRWEQQ